MWREGVVRSIGKGWSGAQELQVELRDGQRVRALAYPALVGEPREGDRVLLNVTAQERSLGTGGFAFVVAIPDRLPPDPQAGPGHIVKGRYTPQQSMVLAAEEQESPWHEVMRAAEQLDGVPVVIADLHSALPAIVAGARLAGRDAGVAPSIAYVMTDDAALPAWFSRTVAALREADWLSTVITAGQSFGGDLEAVTLHSALLAATAVAKADLIVVAQGPGNAGTGTPWGFSGVGVGEAVNAVVTLSGTPVAALRVSGADPRPRHRGISHHSLTALTKVALRPAQIALPGTGVLATELDDLIEAAIAELTDAGHEVHRVSCAGLADALAESPVAMSTMGRTLEQDPAPFLAAGAAGIFAAGLVSGDQRR